MLREIVLSALEGGQVLNRAEYLKNCPVAGINERKIWNAIPADARAYYEKLKARLVDAKPAQITASLYREYFINGDRKRFGDVYFSRRVDLLALCVCECLEDGGRFIPAIIDHVWAICEETSWVIPAHVHQNPLWREGDSELPCPEKANNYMDLFAAETASLLCWVKYLLGSRFARNEAVNERISFEVRRRALDNLPNVRSMHWSGFVPGKRLNNWTPWVCANLLAVALLEEEDDAKRAGWLKACAEGIDAFLDTYAPDGGCDEGPGYFNRAGASVLTAIELFESAGVPCEKVWNSALIRNMADYIMRAHIDGEYCINFADAACRVKPDAALLGRCAEKLNDGELKAFSAWLLSRGFGYPPYAHGYDGVYRRLKNLQSYQGAPKSDADGFVHEKSHFFPGIQLAAAREQGGLYMAVKGGHNRESHNHNDIGNYIIYASGEPFVIDVGVETYCRKTFSEERYDIWTMQSRYHNTVIIDGIDQKPGIEYAARDASFTDEGGIARFCCDIAPAYGLGESEKYIRTLTLDRQNALITLEDEFELSRKSLITLPIMCAVMPELSAGKVLLRGNGAALEISFDPVKLSAAFEEIPLLDENLRRNWQRDKICRLLVNKKNTASSGTVLLHFRQIKTQV